jgi:hypothetical protein
MVSEVQNQQKTQKKPQIFVGKYVIRRISHVLRREITSGIKNKAMAKKKEGEKKKNTAFDKTRITSQNMGNHMHIYLLKLNLCGATVTILKKRPVLDSQISEWEGVRSRKGGPTPERAKKNLTYFGS